jgi:thioredoxin
MTNSIIKLTLFSASACQRCEQAKGLVINLVTALNQWHNDVDITYQELDVVENIDRAVELGILTTPTLVLDDVVIFTNMPPIEQLKIKLQQLITEKRREK